MESLKIPLFVNFKERAIAFFTLFLIFLFNLYFEYKSFQNLTSKKFFNTQAYVLNQYRKKDHEVLKLKSDNGFVFYTTTKENIKNLTNRKVEIVLIKSKYKITFFDFLRNFYYVSYIKKVLQKEISLKEKIAKFISSQHSNSFLKNLYSAMFIAAPLKNSERELLSYFGLSHLVAISGFHFGIISIFSFFILSLLYKPIQQKYFPYRNRSADIMVIVTFLTFLYAYFLGEVASVWRAYFMLLAGFFMIYRNINILSFETLFWVVILIISIFPKFLFSIGFWLSVSGVFYIYLFLHYFSHLKKWQIFILLNIWIYLAMMPIVHYFFKNFSYMQFFSPFVTAIFTIFYPLSLILHLFGHGGLFDDYLLKFFNIDFERYSFETSLTFLIFYLLLSIASIYKKRIFLFTVSVIIFFFVYNIANF